MKIIKGLQTIYKNSLSFVFRYFFCGGCRFSPTCSEYSVEAIDKYGLLKGTKLSVLRLIRCNPFSRREYFDPVE